MHVALGDVGSDAVAPGDEVVDASEIRIEGSELLAFAVERSVGLRRRGDSSILESLDRNLPATLGEREVARLLAAAWRSISEGSRS